MTKLDLINEVLSAVPGARKEGVAWEFAEHPEFSIIISLPSEVMTVPRVSRVVATADLLTVESRKGETFLFTPDVFAGAKYAALASTASARSAGFR